jgi:hypothetical protein
MPQKIDSLERQLETATKTLANCTSQLESEGKDKKARRKEPNWRRLNSRRRDIAARLKAAKEVVSLTEAADARRAEKVAAE